VSLFLILIIFSCKDDNQVEVSNEGQRILDSAYNASVFSGIGNIYILDRYNPSQDNIPILNISMGNDTLVYYGSTDLDGTPIKVNGFTLFESASKKQFYFNIDHENKRLIMESNTSQNVFIEIASVNDTLVSVSGYKAKDDTEEKTILFETYHKAPRLVGGRVKSASNITEDDDLVMQIKDLQRAAITSTHDLGALNLLFEVDEAIKRGDIQTESKEEIAEITAGISKAGDVVFDESFIDKFKDLRKTVRKGLLSLIKFPWELYKIYKILDKYEFTQIEGGDQVVIFGQPIAPLVASLTFDQQPARNQSVLYEVSINGEEKSFLTTSDFDGRVKIDLGTTKIEGEETGATKIVVKVYKGGLINKNTVFTIYLKKRPRLSIIMDNATNNQEGYVSELLKFPLRLGVQDETGAPVSNVKIWWADKTGNGLNSMSTNTNELGVSTNSWRMSSVVGMHKAEAQIEYNSKYVIVSGTLEFYATAKKNDSTELYRVSAIGKYTVNNFKGNGPNSKLYCELKDGGIAVYTIYSDPSWPDGYSWSRSWGIVKSGSTYLLGINGWYNGYPSTRTDSPLKYPVTAFKHHLDNLYVK